MDNLKSKEQGMTQNGWMEKDSDLKMDEKTSSFQEFSQNATVHGLRRAVDTQRSLFRRGFWILIFLGMLIGLLYTVLSQVVSMMSYPTITQQSLQFQNKMLFPAVTLCNLNHFRKSKIGLDESLKTTLLATSDLAALTNINWNDSLRNFTYSAEDSVKMDHSVVDFGHLLSDTLVYCTWDNKRYNCSEIFVTQKTDFGMCYTFNGLTSGNFTPRESVHSGSKYGLTVVANIQEDEYILGESSDAAGIRVVLHDPAENALVDGRGFDVAPGTATKASIKMTQMTYLPPPFTFLNTVECANTSDENFQTSLEFFHRYDMQACFYECRYKYIIKECGCRTVFDQGNDTLCHPLQILDCYVPHSEKFTMQTNFTDCACPVPCEMKFFEAAVSLSNYPSSAMMEQVNIILKTNMTEPEFRRNYLKLTLAYEKFMVQDIRQVPEFTFENIMSTFGGQLGIYIGASLISVLEFLEFGLESLIFKFIKMYKNRASKTKPQSSPVPVRS